MIRDNRCVRERACGALGAGPLHPSASLSLYVGGGTAAAILLMAVICDF